MTGAATLSRLGRVTQALIALVAALVLLRPAWGPAGWAVLLGAVVAGGAFFLAIIIAGAAMAFWSPQTGEVVNVFTNGGTFMTSYPMDIYRTWMRELFTFIIPMAFINYYPALWLLGRPDPVGLPAWTAFLSPAIAALALVGAVQLWRAGTRHYQSTGS
jgi:ABC-2 type transport system permease protein